MLRVWFGFLIFSTMLTNGNQGGDSIIQIIFIGISHFVAREVTSILT
jgi:hypothetical protein